MTEFKNLIERVRELDQEAAKYLETDAQKLESFKEVATLYNCFVWDESPQRHSYWHLLATKLGE